MMLEEALKIYSATLLSSPFFYSVYFSFVAGFGYVIAGMKENYVSAVLFLIVLALLYELFAMEREELQTIYFVPVYLGAFLFGFIRKKRYVPFLDLSFISLFIGRLFFMVFDGSKRLFSPRKRKAKDQRSSREPPNEREAPKNNQADDSSESEETSERYRRREEAFSRSRRGSRESEYSESSNEDPYTILGVPKDATWEEVKQAYRKLASRFDTDRKQETHDAEELEFYKNKFQKINSARDEIEQRFKAKNR